MQLFQILEFLPLSFQLTALMYAGVCFVCGKEFLYVASPDFSKPTASPRSEVASSAPEAAASENRPNPEVKSEQARGHERRTGESSSQARRGFDRTLVELGDRNGTAPGLENMTVAEWMLTRNGYTNGHRE